MYIELTLRAVADRDESCNLFTYTERFNFPVTAPPTPKRIKDLCQEHKKHFLEAWPHNGTNKPTLIPLDVTQKMFTEKMP